ncbi:hypothetical protein GCM10011588_63190 [Nocardia jinanensis]|uniref:Uncharacterized protein n=1 Tax=Nocardia jinanensis TaxID=382504 RepID=A0A917RWF2_9NOCA|nr:hypothetical protein GCM10011588_63190 [Nocardia jinanensis]
MHYELVALVVLAAARHLDHTITGNRVDALSDLPGVPSHAVQDYCYHTIAAIHRAAADGGDV